MVPLAPPDMTSHDKKLKCKNGFTRFFNSTKNIDFWPIFFSVKNPELVSWLQLLRQKNGWEPGLRITCANKDATSLEGGISAIYFFLLRKIFPTGVSNYLQLLIGRHRLSVSDTQHWHPRDWSWILCSGQTLGSNEWKVWPEVSKAD